MDEHAVSRRRLLAAAVAVCSVRAWSQSPRTVPRIGYLTAGPRPDAASAWFEEGLHRFGYVPGVTVAIEYRSAERLDRLPALARELASLPVDVLVVAGPAPLQAALANARSTPIVMLAASSDPVGEGLVESLARPGGNLTGLTYAVSPERFGKQLELLKQAAPATRRVGVWWDFDLAVFERAWATPLAVASRQLGLEVLPPTQVLDRDSVTPALERMKQQRADAVLVALSGPTWRYADAVAAEAVRQRLATVAAFKEFTRAGGLLSYGPDFPALYQRGAFFVERILKGTRAGDLPIELPAKYELAINLKTARSLGLTMPNDLLLRADEVLR